MFKNKYVARYLFILKKTSFMSYYPPFMANHVFHVFNHAVSTENLYRTRENYRYFLRLLGAHIDPVAHIYAYNLLPNHFHLLLQVKSVPELTRYYQLSKQAEPPPQLEWTDFVSQQFSNCFNAYAKGFNKRFARKGVLFMKRVRRTSVQDSLYFKNVLHYIHYNAVHHHLCKKPQEWVWSSYDSLLSLELTRLKRDVVLKSFGGETFFINFHKEPPLLLTDPTLEFGHYDDLAKPYT
jgi:putative transposase